MEILDKQLLWESVLAELQLSLSSAIFQTWFRGKTQICSVEKGIVEIGCVNNYSKVWVEERYLGKIKEILDRLTGRPNSLVFTVDGSIPPQKRKAAKPLAGNVPLFDEEPDSLKQDLEEANLSPKHSFSNFLVGATNQLAYAVARAVVESPFDKYNPLLIYGGVGVGKTHLLQAIGHATFLKRPGTRVLYCSSETFTNDMVDAIQRRQTVGFRLKYRNTDLLLVDDVQFIAGRESTQEEFFHTFNHLAVQGKQVVLTCDRDPRSVPNLQDRLKSRFVGGMVASIDLPDQELREAVLLKKVQESGLAVGRDQIRRLATILGPSIREVEGGLLRVAAVSSLTNRPIDTSLINEVVIPNLKKEVGPIEVVSQTAAFFSVAKEELVGKKRLKRLVFPRQVAMYLLREQLGLSFKDVAGYLGGKDHTTAIYSVGRVENYVKTGGEVSRMVGDLKNKIFGG